MTFLPSATTVFLAFFAANVSAFMPATQRVSINARGAATDLKVRYIKEAYVRWYVAWYVAWYVGW